MGLFTSVTTIAATRAGSSAVSKSRIIISTPPMMGA
jgi:hypothetical protein